MKYLLDTDSITFFFDPQRNPGHQKIRSKIATLKDTDVLQVSILTLFELEYSCANAAPEKIHGIKETIAEIEDSESPFQIIPLTTDSAKSFGILRNLLQSRFGPKANHMRRHNIDLMIASTAIYESSIVVGTDDNYQILNSLFPQLEVEDWTL